MITYNNQTLKIDDYSIKHDFYGRDTLLFFVPNGHEQKKDISALMLLHCRDDNQIYTVRKMDSGDIEAELDLSDLQADLFVPYKSESATASQIIQSVLPKTWRLENKSGIVNRKTIELESATPLNVIEEVCDQFSLAVRYDNYKKIVYLVNPSTYKQTTAYFTDELNLKSISTTVTTDDYATRLYAYGSEGLSFADINGGKPYVDSSSVDNGMPIVCAYWSDDRYTVKENLLQAAKEKVEKMSTPASSYELSVIDLAKSRPDDYDFLSVFLYDKVPLMDRKNNMRSVHQVVEYTEHPNFPEKNEIVLSTVAKSIQKTVNRITDKVDNVIRSDGTVMGDKIVGFINGAIASLKAQYDVAKKQDVLAILFENLDKTSPTFGALALGTQGIMISKRRNTDNSAWIWTSTMTYAGIVADTIVSGRLSTKNSNTWIDMDNGYFNFNGNFYLDQNGKAKLKCDEIEMLDGMYKVSIRGNQAILPEIVEAWKKEGLELDPNFPISRLKGQTIDFLRNNTIVSSLTFAEVPTTVGTALPTFTAWSKGISMTASSFETVPLTNMLKSQLKEGKNDGTDN